MRFDILGSLTVHSPEGYVPVAGTKRRAVLIALLVNANQVVPTTRLIDWLWLTDPPPSAALVIQAHVSVLRRQLEPDRPPGLAPTLLLTRGGGYLCRVRVDQLDLLRFQELLHLGARSLHRDRVEDAARLLREALNLWRGEPLEEVQHMPPAQGEIARLQELRLTATVLRMEAGLRMRQYGEIIPQLSNLIVLHPYHERFYAQLMIALASSGRRAEALSVYRRAHRILGEELAVRPGPELRRIEAEILADRVHNWRTDF
ncbi:hypothetical protein Lfu02_04750 [Longispora fulva]|uniref:DNA-binding SARP family transcriptional activator n=1 Tax=Longispora fulva TaxID=619741 RepID=A0A8J7GPQ1_9ACTN|nr:AfsR/SARP family transcriptional regulator [Longispora fulva]MBG6135658.1 DNA-binding SARP family transcriptional activator [Longispora fulva]GIG56103.1 hypothetical protein Lfu02_04750 [Longispora fulva]